MKKKCLNCGSEISGPFCVTCGQNSSTERLNIRQLFSNAMGHFFNLDSVVPKTILDLSRNPGQVAKRYVAGERIAYVSPFRYCLAAVALMMVTCSQLVESDLLNTKAIKYLWPAAQENVFPMKRNFK